eukprot:Nk52_evm2s409 gene=Nk52_evmTU2s409
MSVDREVSSQKAKSGEDQDIIKKSTTPIVEKDGNQKRRASVASGDYDSSSKEHSSRMALHITAFAMCLDVALTGISQQSFWYALGGPPELYGLCAGAYDLAHVLLGPFMGYLATRGGYRPTLMVSTFVNFIGNVLYSFAFVIGDPWYLMCARFIAGIGSCNIGIGMGYLSVTSTPEERLQVIGDYRLYQTLARYGGLFVPYAFLAMPSPGTPATGEWYSQLFNFYTLPSWVAAVVSLVAVIVLHFYFVEPEVDTSGINKTVANNVEGMNVEKKARYDAYMKEFYYMCAGFAFFQFTLAVIFQSIYANFFAIAVGEYHMVQDLIDMWKPFLVVSASSVLSFAVFKMYVVKKKLSEKFISFVGVISLLLATLFLTNFKGDTVNDENRWQFYMGSFFVGPFGVFFYPGQISFFSKKLSQFKPIIGERTNILMGAFFSVSSLARVLGPIVGALILQVVVDPSSNGECSVDNIRSMKTSGCQLKNSDIYFPVLTGIIVVLGSLLAEYYRRHHSYKKIEM